MPTYIKKKNLWGHDSFQRLKKYNEHTDQVALYLKQKLCIPEKMYFHCHSCLISLSEDNPEGIIDHVKRHIENKPRIYLTQQTI